MSGFAAIGNFASNIFGATLGAMSAEADRRQNEEIAKKNFEMQQKNLDWQKQVQKNTWAREDTAVQRKYNDLLSAGLNPYSASTGSGANSGAIVSTQAPQFNYQSNIAGSMAPFVNLFQNGLGQAFDAIQAAQQIKQNALYTKYMEIQNKMAQTDAEDQRNNFILDWAYSPNGGLNYYPFTERNTRKYHNVYDLFQQTNKYKLRNLDLSNLSFQNELLQKQRDFYVSDKIEGYIMDAIQSVISGSNSARGWYGEVEKNKRNTPKLQNYENIRTPRRGGGYTETRRYF